MEMAINLFLWFLGLFPKSFKGLNYATLKNPTKAKYIILILSLAIALYITIQNAKTWGIIATLTGLSFPFAVTVYYGTLQDKYNKKIKDLKTMTENTELEIKFTKQEMELFEKEMIKDKEFSDEITKKFIKDQERKRKREKTRKKIEKELKNKHKDSNTFKTLDFGELGKIQTKLDINFEDDEEEDYE